VFGGDVFSQLFGGASNVAGSIATGGLTEAANSLFDSGTGFLSQLQMLAGPDEGAGEQYLAGRIRGEGSELDAQIAGLESDLGRFFGETVLPQIQGDAIAAGALGGGRQGVAQGAAAAALGREFETGATNLRAGELNARMSAARDLGAIQTTRAGIRTNAAVSGLSMLGQQYDLLDAGAMASLSPYMALAQILGGPTVLTEATAYDQQQASSSDVSGSVSSSSGASDSYGYNRSSSRSASFDV